MATKAYPGKYDCYHKAADDEPIFTLRAKDPVAPWLVRAWAALRSGEENMADTAMAMAARMLAVSGRELLDSNGDKCQEAFRCAGEMEHWRRENVVHDPKITLKG